MRTRKWVLVLAVTCTIIFFGIYHGWNLFKANEKIKNYLLMRIRPILSDDLRIQKLEMGFGKVHLRGIYLEIPDGSFSLWIEDLVLNYSLVNLVVHGFDPTMMMDEILLIQPRLIIKFHPKENVTSEVDFDDLLSAPFPYKDQIQKLDFIKRIALTKGAIFYIDSTQTKLQLAYDIDGWINSTDFNFALASLRGKLFSSNTDNIIIAAQLNLAQAELIQLNALVNNYKMTEGLPFLIPEYLQITSGLLDGNITINKKEPQSTEYNLVGSLNISKGGFRFPNKDVYFDNIQLLAEIKDWELLVKKATLDINGSRFELGGCVQHILNPQIDLLFQTESFDVGIFSQIFMPNLPLSIKGLASLIINLRGTFDDPKLQAEIRTQAFTVNDKPIDKFYGRFSLADSLFRIDKLTAVAFNDSLQGRGFISLIDTTYRINLSCNISGDLRDSLSISALQDFQACPYQLTLNLSETLCCPKANGEFSVDLKTPQNHQFSLTGYFEFEQDTLQLNVSSPNSQISISGKLFNLLKRPNFNFQFKNLQEPLITLTKFPLQRKLLDRNVLNAQIQGSLNDFDLYAEIIKRDNKRLLLLLGDISLNSSNQRIKGELTFSPVLNAPLTIQYSFIKTQDLFIIDQFKIEDFLKGSGKIELANEKNCQAKIEITGANLKNLHPLVVNSEVPSDFEGQLWGKVDVNGNLKMPHLVGYLALDNGIFNKIGTYKSELSFNFENNVLSIYDLSIQKDSRPLFNGNGFLNNQTKRINFSLSGQHIDINQLIQTITGEKDLIKSHASIDLNLSNTFENPQINGGIDLSSGFLYGFRFDSVSCKLGNGVSNERYNSTQPVADNSALEISELILKRNNEFIITTNGHFPYSREEPLELRLDATGNLLAILPEISSFFQETASQGHFSMEIGGTPDEPSIAKAYYQFQNGFLKLGSVVKKVENAYGVMNYEPGANFIHIQKLVGFVKNDSVIITNIKEAPKRLRNKLKPFVVEDWGLNLGIFKLKTSEKGIKLNIPGLMEKGELGRVQLLGKYPDEALYFAGPWEKPVIRGEARLRDFNFTYPLITEATDPNSLVSRLLERTEWDLRVEPIKDARLVTTIPSAPDNVYVNVVLNDKGGSLNFSGIVADESFRIEGKVESNRGRVEYLDFNFRVEQAGAEFDRLILDPLVYGKARTTIFDSTGQSFNLWLTLYLIDRETAEKQPIGHWEDDNLYFELSSDNPNLGLSDGQILSSLGYSADNVRTKGPDIIGISADHLFFKPLFRPVERRLERMFKLDFVQLSSRFTRNFLERNLYPNSQEFSKYALLRSTRLTVGKYLADQLFFLYTGEVNATTQYKPEQPEVGLRHIFGLEYRILPNLMIEMEYDYNNLLLNDKDDKKIMLRHSFPF